MNDFLINIERRLYSSQKVYSLFLFLGSILLLYNILQQFDEVQKLNTDSNNVSIQIIVFAIVFILLFFAVSLLLWLLDQLKRQFDYLKPVWDRKEYYTLDKLEQISIKQDNAVLYDVYLTHKNNVRLKRLCSKLNLLLIALSVISWLCPNCFYYRLDQLNTPLANVCLFLMFWGYSSCVIFSYFLFKDESDMTNVRITDLKE